MNYIKIRNDDRCLRTYYNQRAMMSVIVKHIYRFARQARRWPLQIYAVKSAIIKLIKYSTDNKNFTPRQNI